MRIRVKAILRYALNKTVNRERFDDSALYGLYLRAIAPAHCAAKKREIEFYKSLLSPLDADLIYDVGASGGFKTKIFTALAKSVVSVEANPAAAEKLRQRFLYNPSVKVVAKACGARRGTGRLHIFAGSDEGYNTMSEKWLDELDQSERDTARQALKPVAYTAVEVTTLDDLIREFGKASYVKIDVEGFEWNVIQGFSQSVPLVSIESNLPTFETETSAIIERLSELNPTAVYNFVQSEPPVAFAMPEWVSGNDMAQSVRSGRYRYMEIYCKSAV
jgi:FkbM family methyltransferase